MDCGGHVALADGRVEGVEVGVVHGLGHPEQDRRVGQLLDGQALLAERLGQLLPARLDGILAALPAEPLADLVAGPGADHDLQPVRGSGPADGTLEVKISTLSPEASCESSGTRRPLTRAPMQRWPDLGVDGVGEVDRGGLDRQGDDVALGREDEDLVRLQVQLQRLQELAGIGALRPTSRRCAGARRRPRPRPSPCSPSGRRSPTRPACASRWSGSGPRAPCPAGPPRWCAETGRG